MTTIEHRERLERLHRERTPFVLATVVRAERPTSAKPGDSAVVLTDGTIEGFVGGVCAESTVRLEGLRLLRSGSCELLRVTPEAGKDQPATPLEGMKIVGNPCLSGGTLEIFLETVLPPILVHVFGESPIARAIARVGAALRYDARLVDAPDAPIDPDTSALVVAAHGRDEEAVLLAALAAKVPYIALVASPKRSAAVLGALELPEEMKTSVHAPAGLDIGASTPEEVAVSIFAEIIEQRRALRVPVATRPANESSEPDGRPTRAEQPLEACDPVCGMSVAVSAASLCYKHSGTVWYFCGSGCLAAFRDAPDRYTR